MQISNRRGNEYEPKRNEVEKMNAAFSQVWQAGDFLYRDNAKYIDKNYGYPLKWELAEDRRLMINGKVLYIKGRKYKRYYTLGEPEIIFQFRGEAPIRGMFIEEHKELL